jgi:sortase A
MNQILVAEKLYITPELKRKKRMYKIDFFISVFLVCILFSYYIYAEYDKNRDEAKSQEILASLTFEDNVVDDTTIKFSDNSTIVILNSEDPFEVVYSEKIADSSSAATSNEVISRNTSRTASGQEYYTIAKIEIPSINVEYPILDTNTDELLKISPCYFWGPSPNEVGNLCIVGHNYRNTKFFSKVPTLTEGSEIKITDLTGRCITYLVYDKYVVDPDNVECTSQLTNGMKEVTLITCTNDGSQRVIVKAREKTN